MSGPGSPKTITELAIAQYLQNSQRSLAELQPILQRMQARLLPLQEPVTWLQDVIKATSLDDAYRERISKEAKQIINQQEKPAATPPPTITETPVAVVAAVPTTPPPAQSIKLDG